MSTTEQEEQGGVDWELSEAIKMMGEAVASGDPELIATAMRRHAEALSNQAYKTLVPTLKTVLESVVRSENKKLSTAITTGSAEQDRRFSYMLGELQAHFDQEDKRYDTFGNELGAITSGLGELKVGQTHLQSEFQQVGELVDGVRLHVQQLDSQLTDARADVKDLQQRSTQFQLEQNEIILRFERVEIQIQQILDRLDREQMARAQENESLRRATIADEITSEERREVVNIARWLRDNRDRLVFHDTIPVEEAVVRINRDQTITQVSRALLDMFGYGEWELIGKALDILLPDLPAHHHAQLVEAFGRGPVINRVMSERHPVHAKHKSGELFPVRVTIGHDDAGYTAIVRHVSYDG